ncbi:MAG: hypothetical protein GY696_07520, partial [Gammaproteobacteria bacterium]|nr:hypothetical protein [Gammaproteobacteria bacterium]
MKGVEVTTPPRAGNPPNRVIQENRMDKTVTNVSTISSVDNSGGLHGFSQINDSNYVPITEKSVVVYNHDGRGGKGVTGTKGKELAESKQGKKGKELAESKQGKGDSDSEAAAGTSTNRAHRLRSEKRKVQREGNPMSYAKAARVSGLRVEIRAASDLDDASHDIDPDIHTLDHEDWDAIEGAIENALSNESMFTNFETFDIGDVILARGHKNGG